MEPFVHLHVHTEYSLLDGANRIQDLVDAAVRDGHDALAITDHGNLFGAPVFGRKAAACGIKPIVGMEAYVAPGSRLERQPQVVEGLGRKNYFHLVLLAENYAGYKNLIKLATAGYLEGFYYRPRIDKEILREHNEGLVCLSACLAGEVATFLRHDQYERARTAAGDMLELFGRDRYWLEMQDHGLPEQEGVNRGVTRIGHVTGIRVATRIIST